MSVEIVESYNDYAPTFDIVPTIRRALNVVPERHLVGLDRIVLTNARGSSPSRRRQRAGSMKRNVVPKGCYGLYKGDHIEIYIDNIVGQFENPDYMVRLLNLNEVVGELYYEIGRHIDKTERANDRTKEKVGNHYVQRFRRRYALRNLHRSLLGVFVPLRVIVLYFTGYYWARRRLSGMRGGKEG